MYTKTGFSNKRKHGTYKSNVLGNITILTPFFFSFLVVVVMGVGEHLELQLGYYVTWARP
jgi:hypothetical protein